MLSEGFSFLLYDPLVDLENLVGLAPKLERSEAKSGLHEHKDRDFSFKREPISRQVIPVNGLLKLPDLLRAEAQHLEEWKECVDAQRMVLA